MVVCNPAAHPPKEEAVSAPFVLQGKRLAFLSNNKPNVDFLFDRLADLVLTRFRPASIVRAAKASSAHPAPEDLLNELAERAEIVINGVGD